MKKKIDSCLATFFVLFTLISCPIMIFMYWKQYFTSGMGHTDVFIWYIKTFWWCLLIYAAFAIYIVNYQNRKRKDETHMP